MKINARNCVTSKTWSLTPVSDFSIFAKFDCGDSDLNDFIVNDASIHKSELVAETYRFCFNDSPNTSIAFVSLLNDALTLNSNPQRRLVRNRIRVYKQYPAVKIGRLAVDAGYQGMSVGSLILDAIKQLFTNQNRTGCRFATVDAYNSPKVLEFYRSNDFKILPDSDTTAETVLLFFDLKRFKP
jgi:GNAT superfamily N-acetyltransferase